MENLSQLAGVIKDSTSVILEKWISNVSNEIEAAKDKPRRVIQDHMKDFMDNLTSSLVSGQSFWKEEKNRTIGSIHGRTRLSLKDYSLNDVIYEYHILRRTIFSFLDTKIQLSTGGRDLINEMIDEGIRRASVEFEKNSRLDEDKLIWQAALLDNADDHIWILTLDLKIIFASKSLLSTWNMTENFVTGKTFFEIGLPENVARQVTDESLKALKGEIVKDEIFFNDSDGQTRFYDYVTFPVLDNKSKTIAIGGISRDQTARKNLEDNLRSTELSLRSSLQSRDDFISIASHELKTPLTSLKLYIQMEQRKAIKSPAMISSEKLKEIFDQEGKYLSRLERLVNDMMDLTIIQQGKLKYDFQSIDVKTIALEALEYVNQLYDASGIPLDFSCPETIEAVGDKVRLEQLIVNLLSNALKYGEGKPVRLEINKDKEVYQIKVLDHGMGIKPENIESVFTPYERAGRRKTLAGLALVSPYPKK